MLALVLALIFALSWGYEAFAKDTRDEIVPGGTYTLSAGQQLDGNLIVFGGVATLEAGSQVTGDVIIFGGQVIVHGQVDGNIVGIGGHVSLKNNAAVAGNVSLLGADLTREDGARVGGQVGTEEPWEPQPAVSLSKRIGDAILGGLWRLFMIFSFAALAVIIALFWPERTARTAQTLVAQPGLTFVAGLLILFIAAPVLLILGITIVLLPVSLVGVLLLGSAVLFGWASLGLEVGQRVGDMLSRKWSAGLAAGIGTLMLALAAYSVDFFIGQIFCMGWVIPFCAVALGVGMTALSLFGTHIYGE